MKSLKVLISAYSCRPGMGSEPGVGWNTAKELAKHHQVWILTRNDNQPFIEPELAKNPVANLQVIYCDLPPWVIFLRSGQQLHYYFWQLRAYFCARQLYQEIPFDLIHHVTYVKYWSPSFLSLLPVPFIWGPVGGGELTPQSFRSDFSWRGQTYELLRDIGRSLGERDPFVSMTARRSILVRATTEDTAVQLRKLGAKDVEVYSESALLQAEVERLAQCPIPPNSPVRFISMARLLHWKGLHLGLRAFAEAKLPDAEYWLLGEGPEQKRLEALATALGIAEQVKFWGRLPREETLQKLGQCHVLLHPSLHDSGGWVCLEAMAAGRPVICLDLGGPGFQVREATGFKIPAQSPRQAVSELAIAMTRLAKDPELRSQMGKAGQQWIQETYTWEIKAQRLAQLYEKIVHSSSN